MRDYDAPIHIPVKLDVDTTDLRARLARLVPAAGYVARSHEDVAAAVVDAAPRVHDAWATEFNADVDAGLEELLRLDRERREQGDDDGA